MRRAITFLVAIALGLNLSAKEKKEWVYIDRKIDKVFEIASNSKSTEILRIYEDGTYEHLRFTLKSNDKEEVERNLGTYQINKAQITFNNPHKKEFSGKFRFGQFYYNGRMYRSLINMTFRKKHDLFRKTTNQKYFKPFFMCLNADEVVSNREASEQLDLKRLMNYILSGKRSDEDKVTAIIRLIVKSVEYDYEGLRTNNYANKQSEVKSILAGRKRLAVCLGYANIFKALCEAAGIKAETISGHTKQDFSDLMRLGGYHAWNIAEVAGKKRLYDVTWADKGESLDLRWVDVDPLVMIGTHLPDNSDYQLLQKTITQEEFLSLPVVTPLTRSANAAILNLPARQFAGKNFELVIPGRHVITASLYPGSIAEKVYSREDGVKNRTYTAKIVGSGHFDGDSTYFVVPLEEVINPLKINIDGQISVKTVVFKGGQTDLMKYYISNSNRKHADAYAKGIIAAIRIGDFEALKNLVGEDDSLFFDHKGKLKINKTIMLACLEWTGDLTDLTKVHYTSISIGENGAVIKNEEESMFIAIPGKLRFNIEFNGVLYTIHSIEVI